MRVGVYGEVAHEGILAHLIFPRVASVHIRYYLFLYVVAKLLCQIPVTALHTVAIFKDTILSWNHKMITMTQKKLKLFIYRRYGFFADPWYFWLYMKEEQEREEVLT